MYSLITPLLSRTYLHLSFFLLSISVKQRRLLPHTRYILVLCYSNVTRSVIHLQHLRLSTLFLAWSLRKNSHITHSLSACQSEQFSGWPVLYSFLQHCWIMHFHLLLCISIQRCISSFFPLSELESVNYIQRGVFLSPGLNDNTLTHTHHINQCVVLLPALNIKTQKVQCYSSSN